MTVDLLWAWVAVANESPRGDGTENYALKEASKKGGSLDGHTLISDSNILPTVS